ncbi:WRKY transcription factor 72A-like [Nymphaea colorata]|nr:WRKY transcription factor 72A-like [Nymphaea colorata]
MLVGERGGNVHASSRKRKKTVAIARDPAMELLLFKRSSSALEEERSHEPKKEIDEEIWKSSRATASDDSIRPEPSGQGKHQVPDDMEAQLDSAKAEMGQVREENERLKMILSRIVKDYQALKMHFLDVAQQAENAKKVSDVTAAPATTSSSDHDSEETGLVSLSLGNNSTSSHRTQEKMNEKSNEEINDDANFKEGLSLGLDCKFLQNGQNPQSSSEDPKGEDMAESSTNRLFKTPRSAEDDVSQQPHVKKARVSVRARCDTATMQDGCQWRKYGQKISKGNPCPRAYYRCTVAPSCPVRKQVQRCVEDMSILITTYEGTHNHPLPFQATAMASTTSAAASMLMSGSSTSTSGNSTSAGFVFDASDISRSRPFALANPVISTSPSYPTIVLDLTSSSSTPQFNTLQYSSALSAAPRSQPSSISFPGFSFSNSEQTTLPPAWNTNTGLSGKYAPVYELNRIPTMESALARPPHQQFYQTYLHRPNPSSSTSLPSSQQNMSETIASVTKAITSDPCFQSALAVAISSIMNSNGERILGQSMEETSAQICTGRLT